MPFDQQEFEVAARSLRELPRPSLPAMPEGHRRLLVLAEFLERHVEPRKFDMTSWGCGGSGCALHWAAAIPEFGAAGYSCETEPRFGFERSYEAAAAFFGLGNWFDASQMFSGSRHAGESPAFVAARIRTFVAEQSAIASRTAEVGK